jgi:hypothetical protein
MNPKPWSATPRATQWPASFPLILDLEMLMHYDADNFILSSVSLGELEDP